MDAKKWEYFTFTCSWYEYEEHMNLFGKKGWELVSVIADGSSRELIFKREIN